LTIMQHGSMHALTIMQHGSMHAWTIMLTGRYNKRAAAACYEDHAFQVNRAATSATDESTQQCQQCLKTCRIHGCCYWWGLPPWKPRHSWLKLAARMRAVHSTVRMRVGAQGGPRAHAATRERADSATGRARVSACMASQAPTALHRQTCMHRQACTCVHTCDHACVSSPRSLVISASRARLAWLLMSSCISATSRARSSTASCRGKCVHKERGT